MPTSATADPPHAAAGPRAVRPRRIETPVGDLTTAAWVSGGGPLSFVLVHGLGASSRYFAPLARRLAAHGTVHALDLPGFGSAPDPSRDLDIADHALAVGQHVRAHGLDRPVLVGHSMGAQVVAELLARDTTITDSAVLLGPTIDPAAATVRQSAARLARDQVGETPASIWRTVTDTVFRCGAGYYRRQLRHLLDHDMESAVAAVTADVLVVRGDRDPVAPREWVHRLAGLAQHGTFLEIPGPHVIQMSHPDLVAEVLLERARARP